MNPTASLVKKARFNPFRSFNWIDALLLFALSAVLVGVDEMMSLELPSFLYGIIVALAIIGTLLLREKIIPTQKVDVDDLRISLLSMFFGFIVGAGLFLSFFGFHNFRLAVRLTPQPIDQQNFHALLENRKRNEILLEKARILLEAKPVEGNSAQEISTVTPDNFEKKIAEQWEQAHPKFADQVKAELTSDNEMTYQDKKKRLSMAGLRLILLGLMLLLLGAQKEFLRKKFLQLSGKLFSSCW